MELSKIGSTAGTVITAMPGQNALPKTCEGMGFRAKMPLLVLKLENLLMKRAALGTTQHKQETPLNPLGAWVYCNLIGAWRPNTMPKIIGQIRWFPSCQIISHVIPTRKDCTSGTLLIMGLRERETDLPCMWPAGPMVSLSDIAFLSFIPTADDSFCTKCQKT